jgi:hypothetical protein
VEDYRINYLVDKCKEVKFTIAAGARGFLLHGDNGVDIEMRPVLPKKISVVEGDRLVEVTKNRMTIKNRKEKDTQLVIPETNDGQI